MSITDGSLDFLALADFALARDLLLMDFFIVSPFFLFRGQLFALRLVLLNSKKTLCFKGINVNVIENRVC